MRHAAADFFTVMSTWFMCASEAAELKERYQENFRLQEG